jgi:hypothetical protein
MPTAYIVAARAVAIACAGASHFVKIESLSPDLVVVPDDLFEQAFENVGILDADALRNFKAILRATAPDEAAKTIQTMSLSKSVVIGNVVSIVEAAIESGGGQ